MMCAAQEYREQDFQVVASTAPGLDPHVARQWRKRAPPEYQSLSVRAAWREAESLGWIGRGHYARYHAASGMVLIAKWGFLATAFPGSWQFGPGADDERRTR